MLRDRAVLQGEKERKKINTVARGGVSSQTCNSGPPLLRHESLEQPVFLREILRRRGSGGNLLSRCLALAGIKLRHQLGEIVLRHLRNSRAHGNRAKTLRNGRVRVVARISENSAGEQVRLKMALREEIAR